MHFASLDRLAPSRVGQHADSETRLSGPIQLESRTTIMQGNALAREHPAVAFVKLVGAAVVQKQSLKASQ